MLPNYSNVTCIYFLYANLSLMGVFFMSGFYSKDAIIEKVSIRYTQLTVFMLIYIRIILKALYTFRLIKNCISLTIKNISIIRSRRETSIIYIPIYTLFMLTIIGGRSLS